MLVLVHIASSRKEMRGILASALLCLLAAPVHSADLKQFRDGDVVYAEDINANFLILEERLKKIEQSKGCSIIQQENTVVITCVDGTSAVLAGAGTVVRYPQGSVSGVLDSVGYNTGDIAVIDAGGVVLGQAVKQLHQGEIYQSYYLEISVNGFVVNPVIYGQPSTESVRLLTEGGGSWTTAYWMSDDCSGAAWIAPRGGEESNLFANLGNGNYLVPEKGATSERLLFQSRIVAEHMHYSSSIGWVSATACEDGEFIADSWRASSYTPPREIQDANLPLKLEQLP